MEDIEEGPGGGSSGGSGRSRRIRRIVAHALARAGTSGAEELQNAIVSAITKAFGDIMLNLIVNYMID